MQDLIEMLKNATGPDRELDGLIYGAVHGLKRNGGTFHLDINGERFQFEHPTERHPNGPAALYVHGDRVGLFTEEVGDALKLVPEGWQWQVSNRAPEPHTGRAYINNRKLIHIGVGGMMPNPAYSGFETTAATPALALCITSLEAIAALRDQQSQ